MKKLFAARYVTPLREGGSLPAIVEADNEGLYVLKFRGAGQGRKALIAELLAGELARALGLNVPELVLMDVDAALGRAEPDEEIRDLLKASVGVNLGMDFLPRAVTFDPVACPAPAADVASAAVWFDAYVMNVDRTPKNTNLLTWHKALYLIDHGASLYVHHDWSTAAEKVKSLFPMVRQHVLLPWASAVREAHEKLAPKVTPKLIESLVALVPDVWLVDEPGFASVTAHRQAYVDFLTGRLSHAQLFVEEAIRARAELV